MNRSTALPDTFVVLCAGGGGENLDALIRALEDLLGRAMSVDGYASAEELRRRARQLAEEEVHVPLIVADDSVCDLDGGNLLLSLHEHEHFRRSAKVLLSGRTSSTDISRLLNLGALNGHIHKPWSLGELRELVLRLVIEYVMTHAPEITEKLPELLDVEALSQSFIAGEHRLEAMDLQLKNVRRGFLAIRELPDAEVESVMMQELRRALPGRQPETLAAGTVLLREGEPLDKIWVLLKGRVQLYRRVDDREIVFHSETVGRIIGLLALSYGKSAFFSCRAVTEIEVLCVPVDELEKALQWSPSLSIHFVTVLLRTMARRNRRSVELQLEIDALNRAVSAERDQLAETLDQLERTQTHLVQIEKMAMLGQLSAGVAHELNNPVSAIQRSVDFLGEDLTAVAETHPDGPTIRAILKRVAEQPPRSTAVQREQRSRLADYLQDEALAHRAFKAGISAPEEYVEYLGAVATADREKRLKAIGVYYQMALALKNMRSCTERITSLVTSLRSYARSGSEWVEDADLHEGLEETLLLFRHALRDIEVERRYGHLPRITCRVGELNQVWTNLIANAIEAMDGLGRLTVQTDAPDPDHVRVRVIDNGPGIAPENLERIFDINFTTRKGQADFGLGIGLPICRDVICRHQGKLSVESRPGRTCFTVLLPVRAPEIEETVSHNPPRRSERTP